MSQNNSDLPPIFAHPKPENAQQAGHKPGLNRRFALLRCAAFVGSFALVGCGDSGDPNFGTGTVGSSGGPGATNIPNTNGDQTGVMARAKQQYAEYCALCHGADGSGYAADNANALNNPEWLSIASDAMIRSGINRGRTPGTPMSAWGHAFGGPMNDADMDGMTALIRSWATLPPANVDNMKIEGGSALRGQGLYELQCQSCHGIEGAGRAADGMGYISLNQPDFLEHVTDGYLYHSIAEGRSGTVMLPYKDRLTQQNIADLVALIRSWQRPFGADPVEIPNNDLTMSILNPNGADPAWPLEGKYIAAADVKAAMDAGNKMIILDARPVSDWALSRIPGSKCLPFFDAPKLASMVPNDVWIVTYCGCPHAASGASADALKAAGKTKVKVLDEGFWVWQDLGFPIVEGLGE